MLHGTSNWKGENQLCMYEPLKFGVNCRLGCVLGIASLQVSRP
uniref:Uncharacterized protein n=1 Tax=Arundo donax TaxID=35708 RepID=A0A0A8Y995_ARUDO